MAPASRSLATSSAPARGRSAARAAASSGAHDPSSHGSQWRKRKARPAPGAMARASSAASMATVPEPHIGSTSGVPGSHSPASSSAAANVSRSGALAVSSR